MIVMSLFIKLNCTDQCLTVNLNKYFGAKFVNIYLSLIVIVQLRRRTVLETTRYAYEYFNR